jgi:DNA-binding response OmpR family regulator
MKVLIVDDEKGILKMYQERLSMEGMEVTTASNGEEGINLAKNQKPDIIMLDIIMPKFNGLDVLKNLKNDPDTKNIPVFLLTNLPAECSGDKAKELGAAGYLVKAEYEPKMLVNVIKGAIEGVKQTKN